MGLDIEHLLGELTLDEKAALTGGSGFWYTVGVPRLGIPQIMVSDGPHGLRAQPDQGDHLGLGGSLPATCFPTASAVACSWDPDLLRRIGSAIAVEARAARLSVVLGPGVNMKRSPLCGRNFEYFAEDPYLAGELGVGYVDGVQSQGVGTSLKHYAANNQETDRMRVDTQVDERTLREIYLPAFERIVTATQPWTVMCAYNWLNGIPVSEHEWLLDTVLRKEFGFRGMIVSDWGAVYHRVPALLAGIDLEMPPARHSPREVAEAAAAGIVSGEVLDARVRKVLELVDKGMPVLDLDESFDADSHHQLAREAARQSIVLLKNEDGILPLAPGGSYSVISEFARTPRFQGAGSSQVNAIRVETILEQLRTTYADLMFAAGYGIDDTGDGTALREEAVAAAAAADTAVVVLGLPPAAESEGCDRIDMKLPPNQIELLHAVAAANPRTVVVLVNGSTVEVDQITPHARGLLEAWLGGQAAGGAIADILTGDANPGGRLAETIPHRLEDNSSFLNFPGDSSIVRYGEGIFIGYRGYDRADQDVAFPFGFGLSYTTFEMSDLEITMTGRVENGTLSATVSLAVTNTGGRDGSEVVQVYVRDIKSSVSRPVRELKGFVKVNVAAGRSERVTIHLDQRAFSFYSVLLGRWVVESGTFRIDVARHSRDVVLTEAVFIDAPAVTRPISRDSTLGEWLADSDGAVILRRAVADGEAPAELIDGELAVVIGGMPMSALANFPGLGLDPDQLDRAIQSLQ